MDNIFASNQNRLKGDGAAIGAIVLLCIAFTAMIPFAVITTLYLINESVFLFFGATVSKWLLYSMPAASLLLYLMAFYKSKRHTNLFLILGGIATAAQLGVVAFNWGEFIVGFHSDTVHLLFTVSLILLVVQPLVTLICFLTSLNLAFPRVVCLLTVTATILYLVMALLAGYWMLSLLTAAYLIYSVGLFISIPKIVEFQREHGHYIHYT